VIKSLAGGPSGEKSAFEFPILPQLVGTVRLALVLAFEDAVGQTALVAVQLDDAFFDRARRDQALNRHRP